MPCRILAWAVLIFFLSAVPAWSWSGKGHRIVGAIADEVLKKSPTAKAKVKDILGGHMLATVSVWADWAKGFRYCQRVPSHAEHAYSEKNTEHHNFHYTDIPYQQDAYSDAGAGAARYDIVHVIGHAVAVLRGNAPANDCINLTQREALWVLARTWWTTSISRSMSPRSTRTAGRLHREGDGKIRALCRQARSSPIMNPIPQRSPCGNSAKRVSASPRC